MSFSWSSLTSSDLSQKRLIAAAAAVFLLSVSCLLFYFRQDAHLAGNDTIYYMALADSVLAGDGPLDLTSDPPQRVRTPQNGIVVFYVFLKKLGLGTEGTWTALVLLNYLLHLASIFPLYRIARRAGLKGPPLVAFLAFYAGSWHLYRAQLLPVNDAIFNTFSLWLIDYLLEIDEGAEGGRRRFLLAWTATVSALLVHFRLQALLVLGPALLVFLLLRRWRSARWAGALTALALASLATTYTLIDRGAIEGRTGHYLAKAGIAAEGGFVEKQISKAYVWSTQTIPDLLFSDGGMPMNLLYAPFGIALLLAVLPAWRRREEDPTSLLLVLICVIGTIFAVVMLRARSRYLLYILPFFYLFLLRSSWLRSIGYLFVAASLTVSLIRPVIPIPRTHQSDFWLYLSEKEIDLGPRPILYSQQHRNPYYFLGAAETTGELTWEMLLERGRVFYVGDWVFRNRGRDRARAMAQEAGYDIDIVSRTPDYRNKQGYALVEFILIDGAEAEQTSETSEEILKYFGSED